LTTETLIIIGIEYPTITIAVIKAAKKLKSGYIEKLALQQNSMNCVKANIRI